MDELLAELGDETRERPDPTLRGSVVAAAAALAMVGLFVIALDAGDGGTNTVGIALGVIALGAGHALLITLPANVRPAGITLVALGTLMTLGFLLDDLDEPGILLFLLALAYAGQWIFGPARGATALLTLALLSTWAFMLDVVSSDTSSTTVSLSDVSVPDTTFTNGDETVSYVSLLVGIGLLLATRLLDNRGLRGVATSALIVGDIAFVTGVFGVVASFDDDAAGSIFIILAGLVLAFVGAGGERRMTTWLGGIGLLIGLLALLSTAVELNDATQFGLATITLGAAIILAVAFVAPPAPLAEDAAVTTESPEPVEQGWHGDPSGRHQLRWHDGNGWTVNVADDGVTTTDEGL